MTNTHLTNNASVYASGYVPTERRIKIYYERLGNPILPPVLFIHGGPGSGFSAGYQKLFDPEKFNVIFYDQRGAGKSVPYCSLYHNTTPYLIADIKKLLDYLHIRRVVIVGPSWGCALGLLFAIAHPECVSGMVLTGVFLATHKEARSFVDGSTAKFFPRVWEKFTAIIPEDQRHNIARYYLKKLTTGTAEEQEQYAYNWALYDISLSVGELPPDKASQAVHSLSYRSLALLTAYYIVHDFFIPDGYIADHSAILRSIPISIIQGTGDAVTPPDAAIALHNCCPQSSLELIDALHSGNDIKNKLSEQTLRMIAHY